MQRNKYGRNTAGKQSMMQQRIHTRQPVEVDTGETGKLIKTRQGSKINTRHRRQMTIKVKQEVSN